MEYDIIIVGAGPAGSTFARVADRKNKILLIDGSKGVKPCGGLLAPDAQKALARFDLTLPKDVLVDPQIFAVKTIDLKTNNIRCYQRMYINVDRERFDGWMLSLVPDNVTVVRGRCLSLREEGGIYHVTYRTPDGNIITDTGGCLVGADGANSLVRKTFMKPIKTRQYVAIQQWFAADAKKMQPFYSCIFDPDTSDCCSWSIFKDGHVVFGGAFAPKYCRGNFERQKLKLSAFGLDLADPVKTEACLVLRPLSPASFRCGTASVFLVGEAAGFISPSSLEGISSAINSAVHLSDTLRSGLADRQRDYKRRTAKLRLKLLAKNLKCPFMYNPFLRKLVMLSGLSSIDIYPDV